MTDHEPLSRHSLSMDPVESRAGAPEPTVLEGRWTRLEPVDPASHGAGLFRLSHSPEAGPELWDYMGYGPFESEQHMAEWLDGCAASRDPLFYTIFDAQGRPAGMSSFLRIDAKNGCIEMGHIWLAPCLQRTREATEAMFLMMKHALGALAFRRLEWKCNALNEASRRSARRLGFSYEGSFYRHMIIKGRNRDTAWYALLAEEWPAVEAAFESWLAAENFDAEGRQRHPLRTGSGE
jgi:RimJ/RimL family protein N-acetyltransferase